jgi:hypothetical protein
VRRQAGDATADYDAPDYLVFKLFSGLVVLLAVSAVFFLTVFRCSITTANGEPPVRTKSGNLVIETSNPLRSIAFSQPLQAAAAPRSGPTGSPSYIASSEIKVLENPTPWSLHIYDVANLASAIAQVPGNVFNGTRGQTISAGMLLCIDLSALVIVVWLFARSEFQVADRNRLRLVCFLLFFISTVGIMTQGVAVWCIGNANSDDDGTCGTSDAATRWGWALSFLNGGVVIVLSGFMAARVCCCRMIFIARAAPPRCCAASIDVTEPAWGDDLLLELPCCGVEEECCCSFGGPSRRFCCARREAPQDDFAKECCPQFCSRGRRCGGDGPPSPAAAHTPRTASSSRGTLWLRSVNPAAGKK